MSSKSILKPQHFTNNKHTLFDDESTEEEVDNDPEMFSTLQSSPNRRSGSINIIRARSTSSSSWQSKSLPKEVPKVGCVLFLTFLS